ncbi:hypothetical protein ERO13_A05G071400v2 [Gossypium hirsutum]|uniref:DUF4228 domain protein n=5 Tax=Gossypium TaxID=3633 RepID=A0ABM3BPM8_GOSHI|nr:uncharacterized protein LOC121229268 [Gossypium hirsutum]KAB2080552.1 hypothetical protein ES319_A05G074000v1 [Gossypium barbadense]TYH15905.1 hypothetical protein ES288_A05G076300v1 [Gossypium darwinii]TYI25881.1 hypothetical protein ES332_A05G077500v1 [Gossypium tomentosum]TYJ33042.1 hypothetical protein E1A91_A05G075600v1 [Gossypium mustelinum]KAG4198202.1 hypothetical protein ERO13_A05G071400v2 [Gossypium hirsutum]
MGNSVAPCFQPNQSSRSSSSSSVKLIFWEGNTRTLAGNHIAGEVMFEFPDMMVCHADSFFIGHPIPALSMDDRLMPGQTYFVLPLDRFACKVLSASSLAALNSKSSPKPTPINFGACPFEHVKGANGRVLIKVVPEFITSLIVKSKEEDSEIGSSGNSFLCSTPELKKHYQNLVGSKQQDWSPKLETISEYKIRFSPCRFIGLEWKQRENQF